MITSADPYVITSATTISTDPTITTGSLSDRGTIYRGNAEDGKFSAWAFTQTAPFDTRTGLDNRFGGEAGPIAAFKFTNLRLDGDPVITTGNGGPDQLALIGVNSLTSGTTGATFTFGDLSTVLLATQTGSITLNGISFADIPNFYIYARGSGSNLTLGASATGVDNEGLFARNDVQVNGDQSVNSFNVLAGHDYLAGTGVITAAQTGITADGNISFNTNQYSPGTFTDTSLSLDAGGTLDITLQSDVSVFTAAGNIFARGGNVNLSANTQTTLDLTNALSATFTATTGDLLGTNVDFVGDNIFLHAPGGRIQIRSLTPTLVADGPLVFGGEVTAQGAITATGDLLSGLIQSVNGKIDVGGVLVGGAIHAGTDIIAASNIIGFGGSITANGNITSTNGSLQLQQNPPGTFGNISAGGNISAPGGIFTPGDPVVVSAGGSISAPGIITGKLQAGTDITIDNTADTFSFGIIANTIIAGGTLTLTNSPSIQPNNATFSGTDGGTFTDFLLKAGAIVSNGPTHPRLSANGGDANPNFSDSNPGDGGKITLTLTAAGLTVGSGDNLAAISSNGGAFNGSGPFGGGNGGTIDITAAGDVKIEATSNGDAAISATSGAFPAGAVFVAGKGGTVKIDASGSIGVSGRIEVSSNDPDTEQTPPPAVRRSTSGGTVTLKSDLTTGNGITVGQNGQVLSLLTGDAPGSGGSILLSTQGADITVNGTVQADRGTVTLDQNGPVGASPAISVDGGTVQAATFNINGSGDLTIGPTSSTAINFSGGTWDVAHDITINAANTTFADSFALNATAGNAINFTGGNGDVPVTLTFPLSGNTTFTAGSGGINADFTNIEFAGFDLNLVSAGGITANSINFTDGTIRGSVHANGGAINITDDLTNGPVSALTDITVGGNVLVGSISAGGAINVGGRLASFGQISGNTSIDAGTLAVSSGGVVSQGTVTAGVIKPFIVIPGGPAEQDFITAATVVATNGIDFSGNQYDGVDGLSSGGNLTINADTLTFGSDGIASANFNGADVGGFVDQTNPTTAGDGGTLAVNTTGDLTVNNAIEATTGLQDSNAAPSGKGGSVDLESTQGTVSVSSRVQVSSAEPQPTQTPAPPRRRSNAGGKITLKSGASGTSPSAKRVAINIASSSQLLSLLDSAATGPGGKVTILATGANSTINVTGNGAPTAAATTGGTDTIRADRGTVDIRHSGDSGSINLTNAVISADVVKVATLGPNGALNIGGGLISADTALKLYSEGSNGTINFLANVTLSGPNSIIAANTVNITDNVVVTISGNNPAGVYTNNPNYSTRNGGNNPNTNAGSFGGAGANTSPFANRPAFDGP